MNQDPRFHHFPFQSFGITGTHGHFQPQNPRNMGPAYQFVPHHEPLGRNPFIEVFGQAKFGGLNHDTPVISTICPSCFSHAPILSETEETSCPVCHEPLIARASQIDSIYQNVRMKRNADFRHTFEKRSHGDLIHNEKYRRVLAYHGYMQHTKVGYHNEPTLKKLFSEIKPTTNIASLGNPTTEEIIDYHISQFIKVVFSDDPLLCIRVMGMHTVRDMLCVIYNAMSSFSMHRSNEAFQSFFNSFTDACRYYRSLSGQLDQGMDFFRQMTGELLHVTYGHSWKFPFQPDLLTIFLERTYTPPKLKACKVCNLMHVVRLDGPDSFQLCQRCDEIVTHSCANNDVYVKYVKSRRLELGKRYKEIPGLHEYDTGKYSTLHINPENTNFHPDLCLKELEKLEDFKEDVRQKVMDQIDRLDLSIDDLYKKMAEHFHGSNRRIENPVWTSAPRILCTSECFDYKGNHGCPEQKMVSLSGENKAMVCLKKIRQLLETR